MNNTANHPDNPVSFANQAEGGLGANLSTAQFQTGAKKNYQQKVKSASSAKPKQRSKLMDKTDGIRDPKPARNRITSFSCEVRRSGLVTTHFPSSDTVCVLNDQTGQSILVSSTQSTRDALASLCQRENEAETLKTTRFSFLSNHESYQREYSPRGPSRNRTQSHSSKSKRKKQPGTVGESKSFTSEDAQTMLYNYLKRSEQDTGELSQFLKFNSQKQQPLLNNKKTDQVYPRQIISAASCVLTTSPIDGSSFQPAPSDCGSRTHFGMSRFLSQSPPDQFNSGPTPSSYGHSEIHTHIDSEKSIKQERSRSPSVFSQRGCITTVAQNGVNPFESVNDQTAAVTPVANDVVEPVVLNNMPDVSFQKQESKEQLLDKELERELEKVEKDWDNSCEEHNRNQNEEISKNKIPGNDTLISAIPRSRSTPCHKTDEELIAFLKEPLALAKAAEEEAMKKRLSEPAPKRKSRAKTSANQTTRTSAIPQIKCNSRSKSTPSNFAVAIASAVAEAKLKHSKTESTSGTGQSGRNNIRLDMPLGQALQEVPFKEVAGQLRAQQDSITTMNEHTAIPPSQSMVAVQQDYMQEAAIAPKKRAPPKRKQPKNASEAGDVDELQQPKRKPAAKKKKPAEVQQEFMDGNHQPPPQPVMYQVPARQALPSVANLLPPLNGYQQHQPQHQQNGGYAYSDANGKFEDISQGYNSSGVPSSSMYSSYSYPTNAGQEQPKKSMASMLKPLACSPATVDQNTTNTNQMCINNYQASNNQQAIQSDANAVYQMDYSNDSTSHGYYGNYENVSSNNQYHTGDAMHYAPLSVESHISNHSQEMNAPSSQHSSMPQTPISQNGNHGSHFNSMPVNSDNRLNIANSETEQDAAMQEFAAMYSFRKDSATFSSNSMIDLKNGMTADQVQSYLNGLSATPSPTASSDSASNQFPMREKYTPSENSAYSTDSTSGNHLLDTQQQNQRTTNTTQTTIVSNRVVKTPPSNGQTHQTYADVQYVPKTSIHNGAPPPDGHNYRSASHMMLPSGHTAQSNRNLHHHDQAMEMNETSQLTYSPQNNNGGNMMSHNGQLSNNYMEPFDSQSALGVNGHQMETQFVSEKPAPQRKSRAKPKKKQHEQMAEQHQASFVIQENQADLPIKEVLRSQNLLMSAQQQQQQMQQSSSGQPNAENYVAGQIVPEQNAQEKPVEKVIDTLQESVEAVAQNLVPKPEQTSFDETIKQVIASVMVAPKDPRKLSEIEKQVERSAERHAEHRSERKQLQSHRPSNIGNSLTAAQQLSRINTAEKERLLKVQLQKQTQQKQKKNNHAQQQQLEAQKLEQQQMQNRQMQQQELQQMQIQQGNNQEVQTQQRQNHQSTNQQMQNQSIQNHQMQQQLLQGQQVHNQQVQDQQSQHQQVQSQQVHNQQVQDHQIQRQQVQDQQIQRQQMQGQQMQNQAMLNHQAQNQQMQNQHVQNQQTPIQNLQGHQQATLHMQNKQVKMQQVQMQQVQMQQMQGQGFSNQKEQTQNQRMQNQQMVNQQQQILRMPAQPIQTYLETNTHQPNPKSQVKPRQVQIKLVPNYTQNRQMQAQQMQNQQVQNHQVQNHQVQNQQVQNQQVQNQQMQNQQMQNQQSQNHQSQNHHVQNHHVQNPQISNVQMQQQQIPVQHSSQNQQIPVQQYESQQMPVQQQQSQENVQKNQQVQQSDQTKASKPKRQRAPTQPKPKNQSAQVQQMQHQQMQNQNQQNYQITHQKIQSQQTQNSQIQSQQMQPHQSVQRVPQQQTHIVQVQKLSQNLSGHQHQQQIVFNGQSQQSTQIPVTVVKSTHQYQIQYQPKGSDPSSGHRIQAQLMSQITEEERKQLAAEHKAKQNKERNAARKAKRAAEKAASKEESSSELAQKIMKLAEEQQVQNDKVQAEIQEQPHQFPPSQQDPVMMRMQYQNNGPHQSDSVDPKMAMSEVSVNPEDNEEDCTEDDNADKIIQIIKAQIAGKKPSPEVVKLVPKVSSLLRIRRVREAMVVVLSLPPMVPEDVLNFEFPPDLDNYMDYFIEFQNTVTDTMANNPCPGELCVDDVLTNPELEPALHGRLRKRLQAVREGRTTNTVIKKRKSAPRPSKKKQVAVVVVAPTQDPSMPGTSAASDPLQTETVDGQPLPQNLLELEEVSLPSSSGSSSQPLSVATTHASASSSPPVQASYQMLTPEQIEDPTLAMILSQPAPVHAPTHNLHADNRIFGALPTPSTSTASPASTQVSRAASGPSEDDLLSNASPLIANDPILGYSGTNDFGYDNLLHDDIDDGFLLGRHHATIDAFGDHTFSIDTLDTLAEQPQRRDPHREALLSDFTSNMYGSSPRHSLFDTESSSSSSRSVFDNGVPSSYMTLNHLAVRNDLDDDFDLFGTDRMQRDLLEEPNTDFGIFSDRGKSHST